MTQRFYGRPTRLILINHGSRIKKEHGKPLALLLDKIYANESQHKHAPSPSLEIELMSPRKQITDYTKAAYCKLGYELGDKCGKLFA